MKNLKFLFSISFVWLSGCLFAQQQTILSADKMPAGTAKINANFTQLYGREIYPENYGAAGDGITDDDVPVGSYYTQLSSGVNKSGGNSLEATYMISTTKTLSGNAFMNFSKGVLKRTAGSTATTMVTLAFGTAGFTEVKLNVDGNSLNANPVVGININAGANNTKSVHVLSAVECDTGIKLEGNVEKININSYLRSNVIGFNIHNDGSANTVDEAKINVTGADNDIQFLATGTEKISYSVHFNVEQSDDPTKYAIDLQNGDANSLSGEVRGCAGGGVSVTTTAALNTVFDNLFLYGVQAGSALQAVLIDAQNDLTSGRVTLSQWNNGVWLKLCKSGSSLELKKRDSGATGTGLRVGDFANSKEVVAFTLQAGSDLFGATNALNLDYSTNSTFHIAQMLEGGITISANSSGNTIHLHKGLRNRTVTNNRSQDDNLIYYWSLFTNPEIEEITTPHNGMYLLGGTDALVRGHMIFYVESLGKWKATNNLTYNATTNVWEL
jgi:hypothetical protein